MTTNITLVSRKGFVPGALANSGYTMSRVSVQYSCESVIMVINLNLIRSDVLKNIDME